MINGEISSNYGNYYNGAVYSTAENGQMKETKSERAQNSGDKVQEYYEKLCKKFPEITFNKSGGLEAMKEYNEKKAKILYDFLDESSLFQGTVRKEDRSLMNVPFVTGSEELDAKFIQEATAAGFVNLKGHRTVGGMRASIYNAMPIEGVEKLVEFMKEFEKNNA